MVDGVILLWFVLASLVVAFRPKKEARIAMAMGDDRISMGGAEIEGMAIDGEQKPSPPVATMTVLPSVALAGGLALAFLG